MTSAFSWQNSVSFCSASFCTLRKSLHFLTKMQSVQNCTVVLVTTSCLILFETPWTAAHQAPLSMGLFSQEYWRGLPFPSPGDLPNPGVKPRSPELQAGSLSSEPPGKRTSHSYKYIKTLQIPSTGKSKHTQLLILVGLANVDSLLLIFVKFSLMRTCHFCIFHFESLQRF